MQRYACGDLVCKDHKGSGRVNGNTQREGMTHLTAATEMSHFSTWGSYLIASLVSWGTFKETCSALGQWSENEPGYVIWHCDYYLVREERVRFRRRRVAKLSPLCQRCHTHRNYCSCKRAPRQWSWSVGQNSFLVLTKICSEWSQIFCIWTIFLNVRESACARSIMDFFTS